jgi:spore maturation protein CgeB
MRIVMCEDWVYPWYGEALRQRFEELGAMVCPVKAAEFFPHCAGGDCSRLRMLESHLQRRLRWGPYVARLNRELLRVTEETAADMVFLYRCDLIWPETVQRLRERGSAVIGYNNDDPFALGHPSYAWRHLRNALPFHSLYFAYRASNIPQYLAHGCGRVELLRSYYVREFHYRLPNVGDSPHLCDVAFVGHWESDGREAYIQALAEERSVRLRLYGTLWQDAPNYKILEATVGAVRPVVGAEYNLVLNSCKIALVFLSRRNNDTYTRRCFEIPAAGTFMLSEHTDDLNSLFREGVEAEYFRNREELLSKVRYYLTHEQERRKIAEAGHARVLRDGHEALDRAKQILSAYQRLKDEKASDSSKTECVGVQS